MIKYKKPEWWPENPYPKDIFPATIDDYLKAIPDDYKRTAISGFLGRTFWSMCEETILEALFDQGLLKDGE